MVKAMTANGHEAPWWSGHHTKITSDVLRGKARCAD
jgi:hypothetical protein